MMKEPTTKKLSEKQVARTVTSKGKPFMKLFPDERFYQYPKYPKIFVSQYANIISTTGKTPHLLSPYLESNYYLSVSLCKHGKKRKKYVHRLVAEVWCKKPDFELPGCPLEVHHKLKVLRNSTVNVNFAMNLEYLYRPHHKAIDYIKSYQVQRPSGNWFYVSDVQAIADYYHTSDYSIYQLLRRSPKKIENNYEIYESNNIKIKIKKDKNSKNKVRKE